MGKTATSDTLAQEIAARLSAAPYGERGAILAEYTAMLGWSKNKVYEVARRGGYSSARKARVDKGVPKAVSVEMLKKMAAVKEKTRHKTGKVNMPTHRVIRHFRDNKLIPVDEAPSISTVNRQMRQMGISSSDLAREEPAVQLRSLHPNHVHQIDMSICVQWDLKDKARLVTRDMEKEFYKNKPGYWRKIKKVLIRYVCTDHTSGCFYVQYYYASGENFQNLFDFVMKAWGIKENPNIFPAHGAPFILMIDKGAANLSSFAVNLFEGLQIVVIVHKPGNPRVNGAVEGNHAFWERNFEGDLSLLTVRDLEYLNARALDECIAINATRRHERTGMTRFEAWSYIKPEQLRLLPPKDICQKLCHTFSVPVTVNAFNQVRHENKFYDLGRTFRRGDKLWLRINPYDLPNVLINTVEDFKGEMIAATIVNNEQWGFSSRAPVIGQEFRSHIQDATSRFKSELKNIDISDVVPQLQAHKIENMTWMPKKGQEIITPDVKIPPLTPYEARKRLRAELKIERLTTLQAQWLDARISGPADEGAYAAIRDEFVERFLGEAIKTTEKPRLTAVKRGG